MSLNYYFRKCLFLVRLLIRLWVFMDFVLVIVVVIYVFIYNYFFALSNPIKGTKLLFQNITKMLKYWQALLFLSDYGRVAVQYFVIFLFSVRSYKHAFNQLKLLKTEIEHTQHLLEKSKLRMQKDFEMWWAKQSELLAKQVKTVCSS